MRVLLTGITGFIGGALASAFAEKDWEIGALVREHSLASVPVLDRLEVIPLDLRDMRGDEFSLADYDVVIHNAAIRNRWGTASEDYEKVNVEATRKLLHYAQKSVKRFVYISSVGVYGYPGRSGIDETSPLDSEMCANEYHFSKIKAEKIVRSYATEMETVIIRPTITYGPGDTDGMMTRLIAMVGAGQFMYIGNGRNHIHLTHIDDLVAGILLAMTHQSAPGLTFNIAGPTSNSMVEIIETICKLLNVRSSAIHIPVPFAEISAGIVEYGTRFSDWLGITNPIEAPFLTSGKVKIISKHRSFSIEKAKDILGYRPNVELEPGLSSTLAWMVEKGIYTGNPRLDNLGSEVMES